MTPLSYGAFRTSLTFAGVRAELKAEQDAARTRGLYKFVTRATVLGRMHEYKRGLYAQYVETLTCPK